MPYWCPCDVESEEGGRCPTCRHLRVDLSTADGREELRRRHGRARRGRALLSFALALAVCAVVIGVRGALGIAEAIGALALVLGLIAATLGVNAPKTERPDDQMRS